MKRIRYIAAILAVSLLALVSAQAASAKFFAFKCPVNQHAQVDPIASPGVNPSAHLHMFFAGTGVTENSTIASLEASTASCSGGFTSDSSGHHPMSAATLSANTAGLWAPQMYVNGVQRDPKYITDYWANTSAAPGAVFTRSPEGLKMVAGDAHSTSPPPEYELFWNCGTDKAPGIPSSSSLPKSCPPGLGLLGLIEFPTCWDGVGFEPSDVVYAGAPAFNVAPKNYPCPLGYKTLPHIQLILHTGLYSASDIAGLSFSSGPYYTLHGDYWQTWHNQATLVTLEQFLGVK